jgi:pimeloyl-ACP methyl ester carboxylesterase
MKPFAQGPFAALPEQPRVPHPYFEVPGRDVVVDSRPFGRIRLHVKEYGSGPPLLLIHGLMTSSYSFRYVLEPLAREFRCIVPDLPGAGSSDLPDLPYRSHALAALIGELVDTLDIRGAAALGNSLGGYLTLRLALARPEALGRLVALHPPGVPLARLRALKTAMALPGARALLDALIRRSPERWAHKNVHYWDESLKSLEEAREYGRPLSTPEGRRAFAHYLTEALDPDDMTVFLHELSARRFPIPLLYVYARQDPMVPPVVGSRLASATRGGRIVWLDEASHFAHVDAPEKLLSAVLPFLRGATGPSA